MRATCPTNPIVIYLNAEVFGKAKNHETRCVIFCVSVSFFLLCPKYFLQFLVITHILNRRCIVLCIFARYVLFVMGPTLADFDFNTYSFLTKL